MSGSIKVTDNDFRFKTDKKFITAALRKEGTNIARDARQLIRKAAAGGRVYRDHVSSVPNNPPASLSGLLARSISVRNRKLKNGLSVAIRDKARYALALETGSKGGGPGGKRLGSHRKGKSQSVGIREQAPRPFLSMALSRAITGGLESRLEQALNRDL